MGVPKQLESNSKKSKVRCWQLENWRGKSPPDLIYITYPEGQFGYDLVSCLNCGKIYSASVLDQIYKGPPLNEKLASKCCSQCGSAMNKSAHIYPEKYLAQDGVIHFQRSLSLPSDTESIVVEFDELY
jgi:hypothetical protein